MKISTRECYAIIVREHGSDREIELCRVGTNPEAVAAGARQKTLRVRSSGSLRWSNTRKYTNVRIEKLCTP
jgi:hypothetical protein